MKSFIRVRLLVTPWTAAHQAPQSMGFSRQEYWSRGPCPSPREASSGHRMGKVQFPFQSQRKAKECSNYRIIALISQTTKVKLKILQARLQQYVNLELPDVQAGLRKGRGTRAQIANIYWIIKKAREFQKNISALRQMLKPLTVWITINCG